MIVNVIIFFILLMLSSITYFSFSLSSDISTIGNDKEITDCQSRCNINMNDISDAQTLIAGAKVFSGLLVFAGLIIVGIMIFSLGSKSYVQKQKQQGIRKQKSLELSSQQILGLSQNYRKGLISTQTSPSSPSPYTARVGFGPLTGSSSD